MKNEANELIEMLRDAREYTRFVGEMGVETVDDPSATIESRPGGRSSRLRNSRELLLH